MKKIIAGIIGGLMVAYILGDMFSTAQTQQDIPIVNPTTATVVSL